MIIREYDTLLLIRDERINRQTGATHPITH